VISIPDEILLRLTHRNIEAIMRKHIFSSGKQLTGAATL